MKEMFSLKQMLQCIENELDTTNQSPIASTSYLLGLQAYTTTLASGHRPDPQCRTHYTAPIANK